MKSRFHILGPAAIAAVAALSLLGMPAPAHALLVYLTPSQAPYHPIEPSAGTYVPGGWVEGGSGVRTYDLFVDTSSGPGATGTALAFSIEITSFGAATITRWTNSYTHSKIVIGTGPGGWDASTIGGNNRLVFSTIDFDTTCIPAGGGVCAEPDAKMSSPLNSPGSMLFGQIEVDIAGSPGSGPLLQITDQLLPGVASIYVLQEDDPTQHLIQQDVLLRGAGAGASLVAEPSELALMLAGLLGLSLARRPRRG